ncbi:MAG: hypothetical protein NC900_01605 [Candidatus Omnitrophica bacterium]|nr:hypothetical protein [Candidatus Omnitrophota bacterium]
MLTVFWPQIKIGPLLRKETDPRFYHNIFKKNPKDIGGLKKFWLSFYAKKIEEPKDFTVPYNLNEVKNDLIVVFKGERDYFNRLNGWNEFLLKELYSITEPRWLNEANKIKTVPIGINVRLGDFREATSKEEFFTSGSLRTPLSWFIKILNLIREILGFSATAFVVSNGTKKQLYELLRQKNTFLVEHKSAITSLFILTKSKILIGSGGSTFSAWASFLGQMPTVTHPGQSLEWFNLKNTKGSFLGTCDPDRPSSEFIYQIEKLKDTIRQLDPLIYEDNSNR